MRVLSLIIVASGIVLLVGCTATTPNGSSSPSSASTAPTAQTQSATALPEPASQFPGTCSQLVSAADAAAALGASAATVATYPLSALFPLFDAQERQAGSMTCLWDAGSDRLTVFLSRHADLLARGPYGEVGFFSSGGPAGVKADRSTLDCGTGCSLDAQIGDYILSADIPHAADRLKLVTLVGELVAQLRSDPVPALWSAPEGSWPSVIDCSAVEASGSVAALLSDGELEVSDTTGQSPADSSVTPEIGRLGGVTYCSWADPDAQTGATLETLAGGGWAVDRMLSTTTLAVVPQRIAGATRAATVCDGDGRCSLVVQVGVNALVLSDRHDVYGLGAPVPPATLVAAGPAVVAGVIAAAG